MPYLESLVTVVDVMHDGLWPIIMDIINQRYPLAKKEDLIPITMENGRTEIYFKRDLSGMYGRKERINVTQC